MKGTSKQSQPPKRGLLRYTLSLDLPNRSSNRRFESIRRLQLSFMLAQFLVAHNAEVSADSTSSPMAEPVYTYSLGWRLSSEGSPTHPTLMSKHFTNM